MNTQWIVETHGDPLASVRQLIISIWQQCQLDALLVAVNGRKKPQTQFIIATEPEHIDPINPFQPLMTTNAARLVPQLVQACPDAKMGIIFRPCEMRAFLEIARQDKFSVDQLLTICLDCLGTLPVDEYQWRAARKGAPGGLTSEALQFARQGGIVPYRNRSACQTCLSPVATEADINIGVLGMPVRQYLYVSARNPAVARQLELPGAINDETGKVLFSQRQHTIAKLLGRRSRTREHLMRGLAETLPHDVEDVVAMFESCAACQACLDVCPICTVVYPRRNEEGRYRVEDISRWLVSCAGCGMCEQACPNHLPLSLIFTRIREALLSDAGDVAANADVGLNGPVTLEREVEG
jgi:formate dehydrogenase subunit beta